MLHLFLLNFNPCPGFVVIFLNSKSVTEYTSDSKNCILSANLVICLLCIHPKSLIKVLSKALSPLPRLTPPIREALFDLESHRRVVKPGSALY